MLEDPLVLKTKLWGIRENQLAQIFQFLVAQPYRNPCCPSPRSPLPRFWGRAVARSAASIVHAEAAGGGRRAACQGGVVFSFLVEEP